VNISALGGLNCVHVKTWESNRMIILCGQASAQSAESKLNEKNSPQSDWDSTGG
jgi:hypothetical protein